MDALVRVLGLGWRLLPRRLRRYGMSRGAALLARKPARVPPVASRGVVVAGDVDGANGLAESARILHRVIAGQGLARGFVPVGLPGVVAGCQAALPRDAALLAVVNAPILPLGLLRLPRDFIAGRRVIGVWAWELPVVPASWREGARFVHEVWAPSQFAADAFEPLLPGRVRVVPHPLAAVELPVAGERAGFGLPDDALVVLTVFNLASSLVRKNPFGAIAAFKAAFGDSVEHMFVLKLSGTGAYAEDLRAIRAAIGNARNIRLLTGDWPEARVRGLIAASDIVLSLHRAEGFGLIPATAMLLGRAVVATGWSGNLAFMTPDTSALVSYRLVPAADPRGVYDEAGAFWAEPDIEDAAARLRALAGDAAARRAMALAGQARARKMLGAGPVLAALAASGVA